jgi:hypothetical protein
MLQTYVQKSKEMTGKKIHSKHYITKSWQNEYTLVFYIDK